MSSLLIQPQKRPLRGSVPIPSDKSISHRAVMLGAIATGKSIIRNWLPAGDTLATLQAVQDLGVSIHMDRTTPIAWNLEIEGRGLRGLQPSLHDLDCQNAGTCMRLLAGILVGQDFPTTLDGSPQLRQRPMQRIVTPLTQMGAHIHGEQGRPPLHIQAADLQGILYEMPMASAQVKSAILLAGLYAQGVTQVYQPAPARDHTERLLQAMGVSLEVKDGWIRLTPPTYPLSPLDMRVPADISSAAFPLMAGILVPHSQITLQAVGINPTRTGLFDILREMGASVHAHNHMTSSGEPIADVTVQFEELHATSIGGDVVVRAIDEFPILAVAGTQASGTTIVQDASELRVKEVDRIALLAQELRKMGVEIDTTVDGFVIHGPCRLKGATVHSHGDHRLGMALAIAGLLADSPTTIQDADCMADSYPNFVSTLQQLGVQLLLNE